MSPTELERRLRALGHEIAWPPTPDLATAVEARIAGEGPAPIRRRPRLVPALAALLGVLVAFGILLAASPGVRATLRDWLGLGAVHIERVHRLPDLTPARTPQLGRRATVRQADRHLGSPIATVRALGAPDAIYVDDAAAAQPARVSLVYAARPGLPPAATGIGALLDELQGDDTGFVQKFVTVGEAIDKVRVNGERGYFIAGRHAVRLPEELRPRLAGNTVIWLHDGVTYRLETALDRRGALALARTVG
jgi:hypothetical protein